MATVSAPSQSPTQDGGTCSIANTPPPFVPAYTRRGSIGSMASASTMVLVRPVLRAFQVLPPSVLLKTPPPFVPA